MKQIFIFFLLSFLISIQVYSQYSRSNVISQISSKVNDVKSMWNEINNEKSSLNKIGEKIRGTNYKIDQINQEIRQLEIEKRQALYELQQGFYCDQCWRPKTQIEREENVSFESHLRRVSGTRVPATPEMIEKNQRDYDAKINAKIKERQRLINSQYEQNNKIRQIESNIWRINNNDIPEVVREVEGLPYSWRKRAMDDDAEKKKKWEEEIKNELLEEAAVDRAISDNNNRLSDLNDEYLNSYSQLHDKLRETRNRQIDKLNDRARNKRTEMMNYESSTNEDKQQLNNELQQLRNELNQLKSYIRTKELVTEEDKKNHAAQVAALEKRIANKEEQIKMHQQKVLDQMASYRDELNKIDMKKVDLKQNLNKYEQEMIRNLENAQKSKEEALKNIGEQLRRTKNSLKNKHYMAGEKRKVELQEWNNEKRAELENIRSMCNSINASCGVVSHPMSYLPRVNLDVGELLTEGLPGDEILQELIPNLPPTSLKVKKTGTRTEIESSFGIDAFLNLKATLSQDPLSADEASSSKMCLEALGKEVLCVGLKTDEWGENSGYIKRSEELERIKKLQDDFLKDTEEMMRKVKNNN